MTRSVNPWRAMWTYDKQSEPMTRSISPYKQCESIASNVNLWQAVWTYDKRCEFMTSSVNPRQAVWTHLQSFQIKKWDQRPGLGSALFSSLNVYIKESEDTEFLLQPGKENPSLISYNLCTWNHLTFSENQTDETPVTWSCKAESWCQHLKCPALA